MTRRRGSEQAAGGVRLVARSLFPFLVLLSFSFQPSSIVVAQGTGADNIYIAGILDVESFDWAPALTTATVEMLNDGVLTSITDTSNIPVFDTNIRYALSNSACDPTTATTVYWEARQDNGESKPDGIVGARCSGASVSLARISQLEEVPQVSPSSNAAQLSNSDEFPFFSRLVAPNNGQGEVGALVVMLQSLGWNSVSILATETEFSKDFAGEFRTLWTQTSEENEIRHSDTLRMTPDGNLDMEYLERALKTLPGKSEPTRSSRIILLIAHVDDALPVLRMAQDILPKDDGNVWVGPSTWTGRDLPTPATDYPGYLGIIPYPNSNSYYQDFVSLLQQYSRGYTFGSDLPAFARETADSIIALFLALASLLPADRSNGRVVTERLRSLTFQGVSGPVAFTPEGDRAFPQYSILNYQSQSSGSFGWQEVGSVGVGRGAEFTDPICWAATKKCSLVSNKESIPNDTYPLPEDKLAGWAIAVICIFALLIIFLGIKYWRSKKSKSRIREELDVFRDSVVGMRAAEKTYIPSTSTAAAVSKEESAVATTDSSSGGDDLDQVLVIPEEKVQWCWQETSSCMYMHDDKNVVDATQCWIKYDTAAADELEAAYQEQGGKGTCSPIPGYEVDFAKMIQTKKATGFTRNVQRLVEVVKSSNTPHTLDLSSDTTMKGEPLPADLVGEPQMVLVQGDIVQISKQRPDGWAFGTKLQHADEAASRQLLVVATKNCTDKDEANIFTDTGWFQLEATRVPSADDLEALQRRVGDTGSLDAPDFWDPVVDPTVVQKHKLQEGSDEYDNVYKAFMSTLYSFHRPIKVKSIVRVQNLAMWQSYVVKRQTICYRDLGDKIDDDDLRKRAMRRFERSWLWHGSNVEVMDKILQQGFNRSFCGKNATMYGKGVYFARDASYSAYPTYAVPDNKGYQYMMACRVVVGEYCRGVQDAVTPDIRDHKTQSLYDSTVGLLSNDTMDNPSIYVTYHDAQAYPEYLITFKAG